MARNGCSGECCVCIDGEYCMNKGYTEASVDTVIRRVREQIYSHEKDYMISWLKDKGYLYKEGSR